MRAVTIDPRNITDSLNEIMTASRENDLVEIAQFFSGSSSPSVITSKAQTFQTGNTGSTTEQTLASYTLPANSLKTINQGLKITASGYWGNNGTEAIARLYFGTSVFKIDKLVSNNSRWHAEMLVLLAATAPTQEFVTAYGFADFLVAPFGDDPSIDVTVAQTIKVTGQSPVAGIANEVVGYQLIVEPLGSDVANAANAFLQFIQICQKGGVNRTA